MGAQMKVSIKKADPKSKEEILVIELPVKKEKSKSGKSMLIASTSGNIKTDLEIDGEKLTVGVNAYIPL